MDISCLAAHRLRMPRDGLQAFAGDPRRYKPMAVRAQTISAVCLHEETCGRYRSNWPI